MKRAEKTLVIAALLYMVLYIPNFFLKMRQLESGVHVSPFVIFPWQFLGMGLNSAALIVTIRALYLQPFANRNARLTWLRLVLGACKCCVGELWTRFGH